MTGLQVRLDIPYAGDDNPKHQLDLYRPASPTEGLPVAVFVHGGAWKSLDRRYFQAVTGYFGNAGAALARMGFAAAVVGYRQAPEVGPQEGLSDVARAVAWIQQHSSEVGADPRCVVILGHSGGALLAGLLAYESAHLQAVGGDPQALRGVALLAGMYSVNQLLPKLDKGDQEKARAFYGADESQRLRWDIEPLVRPDNVPTLLLGAGDDDASLVAEHTRMAKRLQEVGAPYTQELLAGQGHMALVPADTNPAQQRLAAWLRERARDCRHETPRAH